MQQGSNNIGNNYYIGFIPHFISVVAPAYNEECVINEFHSRLVTVLKGLNLNYDVLYVNDGSKDNTGDILNHIQEQDQHVSVLNLSRNFGKESALTAGLDYALGDAVVVIDTDLQDPPEVIPELIAKMQEGYDIVYAQRMERDGESLLKKSTAFLFYRFIRYLSNINIPEDTGDFRILNRRTVDELKKLRENHRFMKGLFAWVGFSQIAISYHRDKRYAGETKWNYWKLWNFALEGITSFTTKPLKIASYMGLVTAFGAFLYAIVVIVKKFLYGDPVAGYPSLMVIILFLGGIQMMTLGIMGEYLARTFSETKNRPLYIVKQYSPSRNIKSTTMRKNIKKRNRNSF